MNSASRNKQKIETSCLAGPRLIEKNGGLNILLDPTGLALDANGNIFFCDWANHFIGCINRKGEVFCYVGHARRGPRRDHKDGSRKKATLHLPHSLVVHQKTGDIFFTQTNGVIRKVIRENGSVVTIAGKSTRRGCKDGDGLTEAHFKSPRGIAMNQRTGELFVCDMINHCIRMISFSTEGRSIVRTIAGIPHQKSRIDGIGRESTLSYPFGITVHQKTGNVYVADSKCLRKISKINKFDDEMGWQVKTVPIIPIPGDETDEDFNCVAIHEETGRFFLGDEFTCLLQANHDGTEAQILVGAGRHKGVEVIMMMGVALDDSGICYVDNNAHRILKIHYTFSWTPSNHFRFPKPVRQIIKTIMIAATHSNDCHLSKLPKEILFQIFSNFCKIRH